MKIGEKEAQRRALREAGLRLGVKVQEQLQATQVAPDVSGQDKAGFDRLAYQREYMRRWRKARKSK